MEPFLQAETDEEGSVRVGFVQLHDSGVREVVVVAVGYHHQVNHGYVFNVAGDLGVAFWAHEGEWAATFFEDGVEEDAQAAGKFNVVAGMAEPCCS